VPVVGGIVLSNKLKRVRARKRPSCASLADTLPVRRPRCAAATEGCSPARRHAEAVVWGAAVAEQRV